MYSSIGILLSLFSGATSLQTPRIRWWPSLSAPPPAMRSSGPQPQPLFLGSASPERECTSSRWLPKLVRTGPCTAPTAHLKHACGADIRLTPGTIIARGARKLRSTRDRRFPEHGNSLLINTGELLGTSSNSGTIWPGLMRPSEPPLRTPLGHSLCSAATCKRQRRKVRERTKLDAFEKLVLVAVIQCSSKMQGCARISE